MNIQELFRLGMDRIVPAIERPPGRELNVGCGNKTIIGAINIDYPEWDADTQSLPFEEESFSVIHCYHFLEHVKEPVKVLLDLKRVLIPNGVINIVVPYYSSSMAAQDLDHKSVFCETTWKTLFSNPYYDKNKIYWGLDIGLNIIIGVAERNLCLMTQLIKRKE